MVVGHFAKATPTYELATINAINRDDLYLVVYKIGGGPLAHALPTAKPIHWIQELPLCVIGHLFVMSISLVL